MPSSSDSIPEPPRGERASRRVVAALLLIISFGISIRLYLVNEPLAGVRMTDTAAVARNFYEESMNIFYPRVDWRGSSPGYVEAEFPIYSFLIAGLYHVFGAHDWLGRLLNIGVYALSAGLLFVLVRRLFDAGAALLAAFFYTISPLSYMYTLTYQPDALMALGMLAGVYWFWRWTEHGGRWALAMSAVGVVIAVLIKPMSLHIGLPLLYLAARRYGWGLFRRPVLWAFAAAILIPCAAWFYHSWLLWDTYGNTFGILGGWNKIGAPEGLGMWIKLTRRLWSRLLIWIANPAGTVLLAVGLITSLRSRNHVLHWWAAGFGVSVVLTAQGQLSHGYYQLPTVFLVAAWMGYGAAEIWRSPWFWPRLTRVIVAVMCLSLFVTSLRSLQDGPLGASIRVSERDHRRIAFAVEIERLTEPDARIIFVTPYRGRHLYQHRTAQGELLDCDPVDFYRSHRKGWNLDERQATPSFIETLHDRGAEYLATGFPEVLERHQNLEAFLDASYQRIHRSADWALYRLTAPPSEPNSDSRPLPEGPAVPDASIVGL